MPEVEIANAGAMLEALRDLPFVTVGYREPTVRKGKSGVFTEGSLIKDMQEAWRFADDPDLAARLKEAKGIGTPATRDTVIEGLKRQGLLEIEQKKLKASELATAVYALLRQEAPEVHDPAATADMEQRLDEILSAQHDADAVISTLAERATTFNEKMRARGHGKLLDVTVRWRCRAARPRRRLWPSRARSRPLSAARFQHKPWWIGTDCRNGSTSTKRNGRTSHRPSNWPSRGRWLNVRRSSRTPCAPGARCPPGSRRRLAGLRSSLSGLPTFHPFSRLRLDRPSNKSSWVRLRITSSLVDRCRSS